SGGGAATSPYHGQPRAALQAFAYPRAAQSAHGLFGSDPDPDEPALAGLQRTDAGLFLRAPGFDDSYAAGFRPVQQPERPRPGAGNGGASTEAGAQPRRTD